MIKCSKEGCKYINIELQPEACVDVPCPECGEILLNKQDFDMLKDMDGMFDVMRNMPGFKQIEEMLLSKLDGGLDMSFDDMFSKMFNAPEELVNDNIIEEIIPVEKVTDTVEVRKKTRRSKKH